MDARLPVGRQSPVSEAAGWTRNQTNHEHSESNSSVTVTKYAEQNQVQSSATCISRIFDPSARR